MSKVETSTYGIHEEDAKNIFTETVIEEAYGLEKDKQIAEDLKSNIKDTMGWDDERTEAVYDQIVDDSRAIYNNFGTDHCYKRQVDETNAFWDKSLKELEGGVTNLSDAVYKDKTSEERRLHVESVKEVAVAKVLANLKETLLKK